MAFRALILAEKSLTHWRDDGTLPGIMARITDGANRIVGFWAGCPAAACTRCSDRLDWGGDDRVHVYVEMKNGHTSFSTSMTADEARDLAASLMAMAAQCDVLTARKNAA